jgi:hypothetical protein
MRPSLVVLASFVGLGLGCGVEPSGGSEPEPLCDGSDELRLGWRAIPGFESLGAGTNIELGRAYLYVRGDCRFWVQPWERPPELAQLETRTGVLDEDQAAELEAMVHYGLWDGYDVSYPGEGSDEDITYLFDTERTIACSGGCPSADEDIQAMFGDPAALVDELWAAGQAVDGGVRVYATPAEPQLGETPLVWEPASVSPAELVDDTGRTVLVDDPGQVAELRALRASHPELDALDSPFYVEHEGVSYLFGMRDVIPVEHEDGYIEIPPQF